MAVASNGDVFLRFRAGICSSTRREQGRVADERLLLLRINATVGLAFWNISLRRKHKRRRALCYKPGRRK